MSILLSVTETFSIPFYIIYFYCGISDMLDGYIARKIKNTSQIGAILDSIADIIFEIIICIVAIFSAIQEGHYIRTKKIDIN